MVMLWVLSPSPVVCFAQGHGQTHCSNKILRDIYLALGKIGQNANAECRFRNEGSMPESIHQSPGKKSYVRHSDVRHSEEHSCQPHH